MTSLWSQSTRRLGRAWVPVWMVIGACSSPASDPAASKPSAIPAHDAAPESTVGMAMPEAGLAPMPAMEAGSDGSGADTGPHAYVRTDGGPFGIDARSTKQTCLAPAKYDQPASTLSATGCVDPKDAKKPAAGLIPYDVNSPLWSDGADKQRFLALPDGALIHVKDCTKEPATCKSKAEGGSTDDEGHFELPVGTVLVKSFLFGGKLIETRLFVRFPDMWAGYSYEWNDTQTDAALVTEDGLTKNVVNGSGKMQSWYFPKRNDCLECHNETVGFSLGLETMQLDRSFAYPAGTTANQLATLEHIGVFDAPVARMTPLVDPRVPDNAGSMLDARARSYLHANCAICHRPEGNYSSIDMRFGVPLAKMNACNVDPNKGDLGVTGAKRLFPGTPAKSVMLLRMQAADMKAGRMPQLATSVLDTSGTGIISDWIKSVTTCP
jgi:uncharacterized repeat protein (TIGR03806 family)